MHDCITPMNRLCYLNVEFLVLKLTSIVKSLKGIVRK